jgi:3-deoxy-D-manno-octulosonic-acid transferase
MVNGRISTRHYARYRRIAPLLRGPLDAVVAAGMQNAAYAGRLASLGVPGDRITVTGVAKFDAAPDPPPAARLDGLRAECGLEADAPVVVVGSTRPGDEARAEHLRQALLERWPRLQLVVAPRHLTRLEEARAAFPPEAVRLRSQAGEGAGRTAAGQVLIVDTMGELAAFYALATVAVIGGSFDPAINGHNPLEPAALGVATVFGPHMGNFPDAAAALVEGGAARQVPDADGLADAVARLLDAPEDRRAMAERGREVVEANRGATERNAGLILRAAGLAPPG